MDVYVLTGRVYSHEGIYDSDGNYFIESPITCVFKTEEEAHEKMRSLLKDAIDEIISCCGVGASDADIADLAYKGMDEELFDNVQSAIDDDISESDDLFYDKFLSDFNPEEKGGIGNLCWHITRTNEIYEWQMECCAEDPCSQPIMPFFRIKKLSI